jgi:hypothetical protein
MDESVEIVKSFRLDLFHGAHLENAPSVNVDEFKDGRQFIVKFPRDCGEMLPIMRGWHS